MKLTHAVYGSVVALALLLATGVWKPLATVQASNELSPQFVVDPTWPKALPAPVGGDGVAHAWVQGEVAGTCVDQDDNVFTVNRAWEVGVTINGVLQGNESGAINGNDASASAIPSPPIVEFDSDGNVVAGWGNAALTQTGSSYGGSVYMPYGSHGCYVDYQGNVWTGGNGDGIVQEYAHDGGGGVAMLQLGTKGVCDGPVNNSTGIYPTCGEANDYNSSHTLLNEPADIAVDPDPDPVTGQPGDVYVADGYGNHRVVVFDSSGTYIRQFGTKCMSKPCPGGTFGATGGGHPHCVVLGNDGLVYACDRPDSRIEVFDKMGNFLSEIDIGNAPGTSTGNQAAILLENTRACDMDFWPNIDYLASQSPTSQKYIVDVDLANDNEWIVSRATGNIIGAFGQCGIAPCPGHNAAHFAYSHTTASDSQGNVYIAETITGRRIQKFVPKHSAQPGQ